MDPQLQARLVELIREKHAERPHAQRSRIIREVAAEQGLDNLTVANAYLDSLQNIKKEPSGDYWVHQERDSSLWYFYINSWNNCFGPYLTDQEAMRELHKYQDENKL